jgi:hypothetical protein
MMSCMAYICLIPVSWYYLLARLPYIFGWYKSFICSKFIAGGGVPGGTSKHTVGFPCPH